LPEARHAFLGVVDERIVLFLFALVRFVLLAFLGQVVLHFLEGLHAQFAVVAEFLDTRSDLAFADEPLHQLLVHLGRVEPRERFHQVVELLLVLRALLVEEVLLLEV
jgi:hypothetical protein